MSRTPIRRLPLAALLAAISTLPVSTLAGETPRFVDATAEAGVGYAHHRPVPPPFCLFGGGYGCEEESMSGGVAVGDVDGDGRPDLFVTRLDGPDLLFGNRGDGTFEELSARVGLAAFDLQSNGAALADLDNDGDLDLYVTVLGRNGDPVNDRNYLFMNEGGHFSEEAERRGAAIASPDDHRTYSVSVGDFDRDGWLDLHTDEWLPGAPAHSRLLRNRGALAPGFFEDVTEQAGVGLQSAFAFGSSLTDLDRDGWPDLAVAADFGTSRLFWNEGVGFVDGTEEAGVGTDENGMGSTLGDFDNDGDLDWFVTSIWDPNDTCEVAGCNWGTSGNRLYRNDGDRRFTDVTDAAGVRKGGWGWGAVFLDYDNDGDLDLAMTNGVDFPGSDVERLFNRDPMRLWRNDGGRMTPVARSEGLTDRGSGKGIATLDYDGDGDLDLFVVNNSGPSRLFRNDGDDASGWLRVELIGTTATNRQGLGAWIVAQPQPAGPRQVRAYGSMSHFLGQSESTAHFGLGTGDEPVWRLAVEWADGSREAFADVPRDGTLVVIEGRGACFLGGVSGAPLGHPETLRAACRPVMRAQAPRTIGRAAHTSSNVATFSKPIPSN